MVTRIMSTKQCALDTRLRSLMASGLAYQESLAKLCAVERCVNALDTFLQL